MYRGVFLQPVNAMLTNAAAERIARQWDAEIVPALVDYVRVPAKSPHFDPQWAQSGHIERVIGMGEAWARRQPVRGLAVEIVRLPGRTPVLFFEVPGSGSGTVLLYGHLDKQPEMTGWREGHGPWDPLIEDGKHLGRGAADDGYALFAALSAIGALDADNVPHARCVGIIETCEESGSYDLPAYLEALRPRLGAVDFVVGLDSGCGDYERLWMTTSLRGMTAGTLRVQVLTEGVHSGDASGVVPSSFRVARKLLDRLEDPATGWILRVPRPDSARARRAGRPRRGDPGPERAAQVSVCGRHATDDRGRRRGPAQSHLAARVVRDRRGRPPAGGERRQCAAAVHDAAAVAAAAAFGGRRAGNVRAEGAARNGSTAPRERHVRGRPWCDRLERAAHGAMAGRRHRSRLAGVLRQAGRGDGLSLIAS